jgi:hypothetical protein
MQKIVNFELKLGNCDLFSAEFVLEFDELVLKLYSHFPFVVQIVLVFLFGLFELFPLVFEHEFYLSKVLIFILIIYILNR